MTWYIWSIITVVQMAPGFTRHTTQRLVAHRILAWYYEISLGLVVYYVRINFYSYLVKYNNTFSIYYLEETSRKIHDSNLETMHGFKRRHGDTRTLPCDHDSTRLEFECNQLIDDSVSIAPPTKTPLAAMVLINGVKNGYYYIFGLHLKSRLPLLRWWITEVILPNTSISLIVRLTFPYLRDKKNCLAR